MATAETARLIASLELKDQFSKTVNNALTGLTKIDSRIDKTKSKFFQTGQHIGIGIQNAAKAGLGLVAAGVTVVGASLKLAGDFEAQLNTINTIARETPAGLRVIGDQIRKVSRDTGTGLADLTQGYYDLLSAGVKAADASKVLATANTLAIGGLSTTAEAVDLLTTALNVYGGGAAAATKDADIFAKTIERGKITAADLAASFSQVGGIAKSSGISLEELGASYARLTAAGTDAAEASTQIRSAIVALTKASSPLEKLQKQTGHNYLSIAGKQGLVAALELMRKDAAKAGVPLIDLVGRVEALNFTLATTGPNFKSYNADLAAMGDASGTAAEQMAERQKGLNFQLTRLKALAKDAGISIGSALLPKITPLIAKFNELVGGAEGQSKIKAFGDSIAGLFSDKNIASGITGIKEAFRIAGDVAPAIANAAQITGKALKAAVDLFRSLPPELQSFAVAGLAVNKLTGGLVTNIAGGLIETVVSKLFKSLKSAVVNVNGAVVNVNGLPGGLPGAPIAGPAVELATNTGPGGFLSALGVAFAGFKLGQDTIAAGVEKGVIAADGKLITHREGNQIKLGPAPAGSTGSSSGGLSLGDRDLIAATKAAGDKAAMDARRIEAAENRNGLTISQAIARHISALGQKFGRDLHSLRAATKPVDIAKFARAIAADVAKGSGSVAGTKGVLKDLRIKLAETHDPKTAAILRAAIQGVQAKLPNRVWVDKELSLGRKIAASGESSSRKIADLKTIEASLRAHGDRHAANTIHKLEQQITATKGVKTAALQTRQAVKDKDLSVTIPITNRIAVTNGAITKAQTTYKKIGGVIQS